MTRVSIPREAEIVEVTRDVYDDLVACTRLFREQRNHRKAALKGNQNARKFEPCPYHTDTRHRWQEGLCKCGMKKP